MMTRLFSAVDKDNNVSNFRDIFPSGGGVMK